MLNEIVKIANKKELQVAAHALSSEGIRAAVKAGVSTIEHAHELTEADIKYIQETHWSGYIVPTLAITEYVKQGRVAPVIEKHFGQDYLYDYTVSAQESIKIAIENHLPLAFGTDAGMFPHAENSKEFSVLTRLGMSPLKAIQAATTIAAKVLKKSDIGTIQPGAMADIIGVRGKPTEDITLLEDIPWVMKNGVVYKE